MYSQIITFVVLALCCVFGDPVPFIRKCPASDSKCLKSVTQGAIPKFAAGLPEYGIQSLDPVVIEKIDASSPTLKLILTDLTLKGIKDCNAKKIEREVAKSKISVTLQCNLDIAGHYDMNGKLLFLPIEGNDKLHVKLNKAIFKVEAVLADVDKNGVKHWTIKEWDHGYKLQEKSLVQFDNLFNGNEVLAAAAQQVIKDNGNEIIDEVGQPVIKAIVVKIVDAVQKFFDAVPRQELADE